jgi:hypothetical protein
VFGVDTKKTREQTMLHQTLYQKDKRTNIATPNTIPKRQSKQCYTKHYTKKTREQTMLHQTLFQKDKRTNNATPNTIPKRQENKQ